MFGGEKGSWWMFLQQQQHTFRWPMRVCAYVLQCTVLLWNFHSKFPSPLLVYIYIKNSLPTTPPYTHTHLHTYIEKDVCKFSCSSFRTGVWPRRPRLSCDRLLFRFFLRRAEIDLFSNSEKAATTGRLFLPAAPLPTRLWRWWRRSLHPITGASCPPLRDKLR